MDSKGSRPNADEKLFICSDGFSIQKTALDRLKREQTVATSVRELGLGS